MMTTHPAFMTYTILLAAPSCHGERGKLNPQGMIRKRAAGNCLKVAGFDNGNCLRFVNENVFTRRFFSQWGKFRQSPVDSSWKTTKNGKIMATLWCDAAGLW